NVYIQCCPSSIRMEVETDEDDCNSSSSSSSMSVSCNVTTEWRKMKRNIRIT
ncbi:unnamed protein product, partial [Candidula unifasciata]